MTEVASLPGDPGGLPPGASPGASPLQIKIIRRPRAEETKKQSNVGLYVGIIIIIILGIFVYYFMTTRSKKTAPCSKDSDCNPGQICTASKCGAQPCNSTADCISSTVSAANYTICSGGECVMPGSGANGLSIPPTIMWYSRGDQKASAINCPTCKYNTTIDCASGAIYSLSSVYSTKLKNPAIMNDLLNVNDSIADNNFWMNPFFISNDLDSYSYESGQTGTSDNIAPYTIPGATGAYEAYAADSNWGGIYQCSDTPLPALPVRIYYFDIMAGTDLLTIKAPPGFNIQLLNSMVGNPTVVAMSPAGTEYSTKGPSFGSAFPGLTIGETYQINGVGNYGSSSDVVSDWSSIGGPTNPAVGDIFVATTTGFVKGAKLSFGTMNECNDCDATPLGIFAINPMVDVTALATTRISNKQNVTSLSYSSLGSTIPYLDTITNPAANVRWVGAYVFTRIN